MVFLDSIPDVAAQNNSYLTLKLSSKDEMPEATIEDVAWLAGHWQGEMFGGTAEAVWSPPYGGTVMGMYKHVVNGDIKFYELMVIVEESKSLVLKLKHFNADLTAWEEKEKTVDFPLVKLTQTEIFFDGLTFRKIDDDTIKGFLRIKHDGKVSEVDWTYRRISN